MIIIIITYLYYILFFITIIYGILEAVGWAFNNLKYINIINISIIYLSFKFTTCLFKQCKQNLFKIFSSLKFNLHILLHFRVHSINHSEHLRLSFFPLFFFL